MNVLIFSVVLCLCGMIVGSRPITTPAGWHWRVRAPPFEHRIRRNRLVVRPSDPRGVSNRRDVRNKGSFMDNAMPYRQNNTKNTVVGRTWRSIPYNIIEPMPKPFYVLCNSVVTFTGFLNAYFNKTHKSCIMVLVNSEPQYITLLRVSWRNVINL